MFIKHTWTPPRADLARTGFSRQALPELWAFSRRRQDRRPLDHTEVQVKEWSRRRRFRPYHARRPSSKTAARTLDVDRFSGVLSFLRSDTAHNHIHKLSESPVRLEFLFWVWGGYIFAA